MKKDRAQQALSLLVALLMNILSIRHIAWASIPSFSELKLTASNLKNRISDHFSDFNGFLHAKIGANSEMKGHILITFNDESGYNKAIASPVPSLVNVQFT